MRTLRDAITGVLKDHPEIDFRFCRLGQHESLLDAIAERFLTRGRQDLNQVWLHACFADITETCQPPDIFAELRKRVSVDENYWFLASEENGKYWVAEGNGAAIIKVIVEMHCFEYYIIDRQMTWLICENHHNMLIQARARDRSIPVSIT
ncbi:DUF6756 family protein [Luteolibacter soli]|uniref:DUF6756 family protein n=1 Tax=Luteolibacter soli TaxID=3135280 RepID=A0ABU9ATW1_9BACT